MPDVADLQLLLVWLATSGAASWMVIWSDFFRNLRDTTDKERSALELLLVKWATGLSPLGAQIVSVVGAVGVPALAAVLVNVVPADVFATVQPYYAVIASILTAFLGMRAHYLATKQKVVG